MDITVYNKDVTKGMEEIDTGSVDLIITSPPYWNLKDYKHPKQLGLNLTYKHYLVVLEKVLLECMRVIRHDAFICINVGDVREKAKESITQRPRLYSIQASIINYFLTMDFDLFQHFIWEKHSVKKDNLIHGSTCNGKYKDFAVPPFLYSDLNTEHILVFRKPGIRKRPTLEERQSSEHNLIKKITLQDWLHPVWKINSPRKGQHKGTFPKEIPHRLIKIFSLKGETVLDPFAGTGTTLVSAIENQRNAIGYELNSDFIQPFIDEYELTKRSYEFVKD
ncbi:site-specific DNA-methyltransferase (adenine-specific) [Salirhabdus euzebyi]|uniref:Methyltransferase n=1 Tax=Salirhabdus euzebyi TaxID=394506 RepID=A0A841Q2V5_9BACI|nr:site-specific DNA-methyltransferase [Salirhabdus euzebyi]MBB6451628.1 site-specific DNA-methyltransferase (adenine-specific) [Salirhabdus euzebyi]